MSDKVDALVIFGATGDLAKIETFPALVGLVERGVLDMPVVGVAKSGWGLEQFRDYATASLKLNNMDPTTPAATKMLSLLRYVDGDLGDRRHLRGHVAGGRPGQGAAVLHGGAGVPVRADRGGHRRRRPGGRRAGDGGKAVRLRPGQLAQAQRDHAPVLPGGGDLPGRRLAGVRAGGERAVRAVRQRGGRAAAEPDLCGEHPDHHGRGVRRVRPWLVLRPDRRHPRRGAEPHAAGAGHGDGRPARRRRPEQLAGRQGGPGGFAHPADPPGRGARPVRGLPRREGRRPPLDRGNLRRHPAGVRLLAVGGRADRDPGRQVHAGHRHRGDRPVPPPAPRHLRARPAAAQQRAPVPALARDRGLLPAGGQEAGPGLGAADGGADVRPAARQ